MSFISKGQQVLILSDTLPDSIYVYDNFNIQGTTLIDSDNGFSGEGWNGSWSKVGDSVFVKSGTLNYPDSSNAVNSGLSVNKDSTGLKSTISRYLYDSYELADTATFYLSFLARKDSWGEFSLEGYGGTNLRYGVKVSAIGAVSVRASTAWSGESLAGTFKNDITYLVVIAKQGNTVRAALFQDGDSIPAEPSATTWVSEKTAATGVDMDRLVFTFDVGSVEIDEIKLGNTFKSVTNNNFWDSGLNAPTNLSLTPDTVSYSSASTSVTVSWNDNSLNEDGFDIYMDGQKLTSVGANITSYDLDTVLYGATANFQVRSFNSAGFSQRTDFKTLAVINESEIYLRYPEDSSTVYQTIPYFEWSHPKDQSFNGYFEIEIDDNLDFSSRIDVDTIPSFINYYVPDFELNTAVTYYWRLRYLDQSFTSNTAWSSINQFQIEGPEVIINVSPSDDWDGIRNKWFALLDSSETVSGAVELRFPIDGNLAITQDPNSDLNDRKNGFLLYNDGYDNIIVNGQGCTITLEATHGEENCGFMEVTNSTGVQVKDIIIDYHPNSTMQLGGVVQNFDVANRTFNVVVEPEIFETYDVLSHYNEGYFLTKERKQKIGEKGIAFEMEETWEEARTKDNLFQFTAKSGFNRYEDELKDGDYFVLSHRAGDIIYLDDNATNVVINGLTTYACRGRWFSCSPGTNARLVNNNYLAKEGRFMGSASGGIGADRGDNMWYENNRFEYSRDDMFHSGSNSGKGMVFRNNSLIGAYRNSIWVKADRTWVANNTIENSATSGIHIGYAPSTPGTMGKVILAENNIIKHSGWRGIHIDSDPGNADFETGSIYNENIYVRNNKIFDNIRDEAILIEYAKDAHIENNLIDNTDKSLGWSPYSIEDDQKGIYVKNSHGVHGGGNLVVDSRLNSSKLLLKDEETTTNITLTANGNITPDSLGEDRDLWVYDDFSITGDSLIDNGDSGYGWSGPWVYASGSSEDILLNDSVTLTYPSTSSSASLGGHIYKTSAGVTTIERALGTSYELHNTTQYFSLLAKKNSSGAFSVEGYGSSLLRYGLKVNTDGSMEARAANNWSSPALSGTFENDETYLVVLSREDDVNKLALFKAGETVPSDTVGVSWVTIGTGNTGVDMDTLNLVITSGEVAIDELRFGNSWQSVTQGSELVESVYPVSGATSVSVDSVISVGFLNSMDKNSTENAINIRPALDDAVYVWSASSLEIITRRLRDSTDYQVTIGHSAKTFDSIPLIGGYGFSFHTTNVAPSLDSIYPADEALGIPVSTDIVLNFSEPMDANSVETNLNFTPSLDNEQYSWSSDSSTLTITTDGLEYETTYSISLSVGASDIHGKGLNSALSYDFSTVANDLWVYDDFSITGDSLIDNGDSGYGWSGPWVYASGSSEDILLNDSVTLTYPSTSSSASLGGHIYKTSAGVTTIERALGTSYELHNTTQYFSLLAKKNSSGAFSVEGYGSSLLRYGLKVNTDGSMEARAANNWSSPALSGTFENDETYLVVLSREDDVNKLALFKAGETVPSDTVGVSWVTIGTGNTGVDMDTLNLVITSGEVAIDELRFGNSWQSVTQGSELVESVYPVSGATGVSVDPTNKVTIKFRTVMDEPSVEDALSISPEIANAKFNWVNNELRISGDRLLDSTWYSVTVKRSAKTNNNLSLMEGFQFTFLTSNNTPVVTNISPEDGEMDVNPVSSVVIDFSKSMNVDSVENNIRFYPEVSDPLYSWSIDSSTVSIFLSNLLSDRLYAISIDTGAVDFNGDRLESIYNSSFITGDNTIWVYDDFQIAGDTLKTNGNSGYGWGGDWYYDSGNEDILINESASLSYPSSTSASSQVGYIYKTSVGETRIERTLSNGYDLKNTNQYLSFLAEKQSGSSLELQGYDSNYSLRFGVRVTSSGEVQVRAGGQWSSASTSGSFSNDQTYLVVIAKESDLNRVALFKEGDSIPSSLTAVNWIASEVGTTGITLDRIRLKINGAAKFDEFRFCNSWTGAVFGNVSQSNARSALIPENIQSDENLPPTLTLYPNPAIDEICLKLENTSDTAFNFQIMNLAGAKVLDEKIDLRRESPSLDISALTEGCYVVIVTSESHQIIKKIIVK